MKKLSYIILAIMLINCGGENTFETENGTKITYHKKGSGDEPSDTLISYFLLKYETIGGKVFFESQTEIPTPIKLDSNFFTNEGTFFEVLGKMIVGDSLSYQLSASELFIDNFKGRVPDSVDAEDKINIYASFLSQVTTEDHQQKSIAMRREQMLDQVDKEQVAKDVEIIDAYLEENGIQAEKSETGIRYTISDQGNGPKPKLGQGVKVHYAGRLLTGEYFDTSMEDVAKAQGLFTEGRPYEPFPIQIYNSSVITGWHEGISLLNEGTKATLYIPSPLAYGPRKRSEVIEANSILVFDVELVEVE
ncbi:MAG: FKBP-type peptidyl-prolyl cis-trans isomerase [Bacteroidota bacterium]